MVNNIPNQFGGTLLNQRSFRGSHVLEVKINLRHQPGQIDVGMPNVMSDFGLDGIISELNFCDVEHEMEFKPEKTYTGFIFCGVYDFVAGQYYPDIALPTYRSVSEPLRKGTVVLRCTQWPDDFDPEHPERDKTYGDKINERFVPEYSEYHPSLWGEEEFTIGTETKKVREWLSEPDARVQPHDKILKQFLRGPTGTKHNSWNDIQTDYRGHNLELLMVGITYQGGNWQIKSGQMNNHYYTLADHIPEYLHRSEYEDLQLIQSIYSENLHNTLPIFAGLNQGIKNKLDRHKNNDGKNELNQIFGRRQNINLLDGRPNELTGEEVRTILRLVTEGGRVNHVVSTAYYRHGARNNQNAFGSQSTMSRYLNDLVYNICHPDLFFGEHFDIFSISGGGRHPLRIEAWQKDLINKSFIKGKTNIPPSIPYFNHSRWNNYIVQKGIIYLRHPDYSISSFYKPPDNITDDHSYFIRLPSDGNIVNFNVQQLDVMFDGLSKKLNYKFDLHSRPDLNRALPLLGAVETNAFWKDLIHPSKDIILGLINDSMDDQSKPFLVEFFTRVIDEAAHDFTIYNNLNNILSFIFILIVVINNPRHSINNNRRRILKLLISKMYSSFQSIESLQFSTYIDSIPDDSNYRFLLDQMLQIKIRGELTLHQFRAPALESKDTPVNIDQHDLINYLIGVKMIVTNNGREQGIVCKTPIVLIPEWIRNNTADWTTKNPDGTRKVYNHNIIRRSMNPERKIRVRPITITRNIEGYNQLSSNLIDKLLDSAPVITNAIDSYSTKCIERGCIKELLKYLQVKHRSMDMILNQNKASVIFYDNTKGIILSPKELSQPAYEILTDFISKYGSQNALVPNKYYYINTATNQLELKEVADGGRQRVPGGAPAPQAVQQPVPPRAPGGAPAPQSQANPYSNQILNEMIQGADLKKINNRRECENNFGFFAGRPGNKNCIRRNQTSATRGADNCERARDVTGSCPTGPDNDCYIHKFGNNPTTDCIPKWSYKNGVGTVLWRQQNSDFGNSKRNQYGDTEDTLIPATQRTQQKYLKYKLKYLRLKEIARKHNIKID